MATPIGHDLDAVSRALRGGEHGIRYQPAWDEHPEMLTRLGGEVQGLDLRRWPRKKIRSMGRVALLATHASEAAVQDAGLQPEDLHSGRTGLAYGSTHGSSSALERFARKLDQPNALLDLGSNGYLKFMSHTCAVNLATFFGIRGRITTTCSACVSGSQAIGFGYETIRYGMQDVMICGGAEELHYVSTGVFDVLQATSTRYNRAPEASPRPFDRGRDGLVVGEGAGTVVLERRDRAMRRGAPIYGEIVGFGTSCDGTHVTSPVPEGMTDSMRLALEDAETSAEDIDYVNAHATGTEVGDVGESRASWNVFGDRVPVSSTKGYTGHTLGASGAIETLFCLAMMREGFVPPGRNLEELDPECAPLDYVRGEPRALRVQTAMNNNFSFGGINTSLILRST
jgi:3-oxoacyl-[acyl-carrier-protein] synthase II